MASKTISVNEEAYDRLYAHRRGPGDSFSRVILRARWDEDAVTAGELLECWKDEPPFFSGEELERIEEAKTEGHPPADKWNAR